MRVRFKKSIIHKNIKQLILYEYDVNDVIDYDNSLGNRKYPYIDKLFRKKLKLDKDDRHPKSRVIKGIAISIFYEYIKLIIEKLFEGEKLELKHIGIIYLKTMNSSSKYSNQANKKDVRRSKKMGYYTKIFVEYDFDASKCKFNPPFWALGESYKKRLIEIENTGKKF